MIDMKILISNLGSLEKAREYVSQLGWNLTVEKSGGNWFVMGGEKILFYTDNKELVDIFIYGMALAMNVISPIGYERLKREIEDVD